MEYKHSFAGVSSNGGAKFFDNFNELYNYDGEFAAISKNEYQCFLGNKTINYRVGIEIMDDRSFESNEENKLYMTMYFVPCFRNIHKSKKNDLLGGVCEEEKSYYGKREDTHYFVDAIDGGYTVLIHYEVFDCNTDDDEDITRYPEAIKILDDIANTYNAITGLCGFYLDRCVNRIGETGWDKLRELCNGVKLDTIIKEIRKRYKEAK